MEEFWIQLLTILTLLTQTCSVSDTTELIGAVGGSVTFRSPDTRANVALWIFGNEHIMSVALEDPPHTIFYKEDFKTRFTVSESGRALSISQLRMEDAGNYSVNIDGKTSTFSLRVYKELTEPTVTCEAQDCLDRVCLLSLRCSVPGAGFGNVSYTWRGWDHLWEDRSVVLTVVDKPEPLRCTAQNAVSSRSVTVTIPGGLCSEISTQPPRPGSLSSSGVKIGLIAGATVVVVILLVFLVFPCKSRGCGPARPDSGSAEISPTAGPGHRNCSQAMRLLEPAQGPALGQCKLVPGLALDTDTPLLDQSISTLPSNQLRLMQRWPLDEYPAGPRRSISEPAWLPEESGPEPGPALDKHRPEPGVTTDQHRPEPGPATDQHGPEPGLASDQCQD